MNNNVEDRKHISTLLKLVAPDSVEVELVPLSSIEKVEFLFFWVTIFLTVLGTVLGTYLSLTLTAYDNKPVVLFLEIALGFLTILVVSFSITAFVVRSKSRKKVKTEAPTASGEKADRIIRFIVDVLPDKFTEEEFKALINKLDDGENDEKFQGYMFSRAVSRKLIVEIDGHDDKKTFAKASRS